MTITETEAAQLILRERQSRDRGWWDRMAECYADASIVDISWFTGSGADFVRASSGMTGRGDHAVHRLSPPFVRVVADRALVELPIVVEFRVDIDGTEADLASYARSQYRAERRHGTWRIVRFTAIYERDTLVPAVPGTELAVDPADLRAFRPSYRCLAWHLGRRGYPIGADLLGEDRPEEVARYYRTDLAWLESSTSADAAPDDAKART